MILLRGMKVDAALQQLASDLRAWSGMPVAFVLDERNREVDAGQWPKISLSDKACANIGLYRPRDYAWRCGDYGLYLARQKYPDVKQFWLFEADVRIGGSDPAAFFRFFEDKPHALLAGYLESAPPDWPWYRSAVSRDNEVLKCFFPVCRLSAEAIDTLYAKRLSHAQHWSRRYFWPNDEAFVATGVAASGLSFADLNAFGTKFYDHADYSFETLRDAMKPFPSQSPVRLFHPVLYGEELRLKQAKLDLRARQKGKLQRLTVALNRRFGPAAWSAKIDSLSAW